MSKAMVTCGILFLLGTLILGACGSAPATPTSQAGLPNPASVYCVEHGGTVEIVTAADGSQSGVCHFDDGSSCDEWAFFRGDCTPGN